MPADNFQPFLQSNDFSNPQWPNAELSFWIMATSAIVCIPVGMVMQKYGDALWGLVAIYSIWIAGGALMIRANSNRSRTVFNNFLLYLCCVGGMIAFSVHIMGLQPEFLYIYLPLLIVVGIAAAYRLESLVQSVYRLVIQAIDIAREFARFLQLPQRKVASQPTGPDAV